MNKSFHDLLELLSDMHPIGNTIQEPSYVVKKMLKPLGLDYVMIHACKNYCILYWKEYKNLQARPKYGKSN